mgnify:CR=1 FL=1
MADSPVLVCTAGALEGTKVPIPDGGVGIGRSEDNTITITDDGVSRFHARLLYDNGSLWLQDAGSRNGVFVNGVRITGHKALKVGDTISIAQHTFELRWQDEPSVEQNGDASDEPADAKPKRRWFWPFS